MKNKIIDLFSPNYPTPSSGEEYSHLLEQFIAPFQDQFRDYEYLEDIFDIAIAAWNLGNMQILMPNEDYLKVLPEALGETFDAKQFEKMIKYKEAKFKEHTRFIVDFMLEPNESDPVLTVMTEEAESFLNNLADTMEAEHMEEDFDENYINRQAIFLKPKEPFFEWLRGLDPENSLLYDDDANIYLVNDEIADLESWLKKKFDRFFQMELEEWHTNKKEWPQRRNYKMFKDWFWVETSTLVYDMEKQPVYKTP